MNTYSDAYMAAVDKFLAAADVEAGRLMFAADDSTDCSLDAMRDRLCALCRELQRDAFEHRPLSPLDIWEGGDE